MVNLDRLKFAILFNLFLLLLLFLVCVGLVAKKKNYFCKGLALQVVFCRILNKLTPEKFDKLSLELLNVGIDSPVVLKGVILLVGIAFIR